MTKLVGYQPFMPAMAGEFFEKEKKSDTLTEVEFRQLLAVTFRDAVIKVMEDTKLYRTEIPIDLYQNVDRYDIPAPDGYQIVDVIRLNENKVKIPNHSRNLKSIRLVCCPNQDVSQAFYVEVAIKPKRLSGGCEFDECFVDQFYELILERMRYRFYGMRSRNWYSLGSRDRSQREYSNLVSMAKRTYSGVAGSPIRVAFKRASESLRPYKLETLHSSTIN